MARLLHVVQCPEGSGFCASYSDSQNQRIIAVARGNYIQFYTFEPDHTGFLKERSKTYFEQPITSMAKVRGSQGDSLIAIANNTVYDVTLDKRFLMPCEDFGSSPQNFLMSFSVNRKVAIARLSTNGRTYVIYNEKTKRPEVKVSSLGCAQIKQAVTLENSDTRFAVLYTSFDLSYSLKYLELDKNLSVNITSQFQAFVEAPSLVVPMTYGGVMVLSNYRIYLFPAPNQTTHLADSFEDQRGTSVSNARNVITIDIKLLPYLTSLWTSYSKIDLERYLLSTDTGLTAVAYIRSAFTASAVSIEAFSIHDIGKSTIAQSMCHVENNVFFAASKYSRSILFKIMPTEPHILILSFMPSSPPVIDLAYSFHANTLRYLPDIFVCQGGFHSGELRKISYNSWKATQLSTLRLDDPFAEVVLLLPTNPSSDSKIVIGIKVNLKIEEIYTISNGLQKYRGTFVKTNLQFPQANVVSAVLSGTFTGQHKLQSKDFIVKASDTSSIKYSKLLSNGMHLYVSDNHIVCESGSSRETCDLQFSENSITAFDAIFYEGSPASLVGYTDGQIEYFRFNGSKVSSKLSLRSGDKNEGLRDAKVCFNAKEELVVVALDNGGNVHQYLLEHDAVIASSVWNCKGPGPTAMGSDGSMVVLYDTHKVLGLVPKRGNFLNLCDFFYSPKAIRECVVLLKSHALVGVYLEDRTFVTVSHEDKKDIIDAHFSDKLWTKVISIPRTHYLVCIKTDIRPTKGQSRVATLNLLDGRTMRLLHTFSNTSLQFSDICYVPPNELHGIAPLSFVALQTGTNSMSRFPLFKIEGDKIREVPNVHLILKDMELVSFSVVRYDPYRECLHAAGEDFVLLSFTNNNEVLELRAVDSIGRNCVLQHVTDIACEPERIFILDSFRGLYEKTSSNFELKEQSDDDSRITAICALPTDSNQESSVVFGDSLGRVHINGNVFQVYSQINTLKYVEEDGSVLVGTLNGGIYRLKSNLGPVPEDLHDVGRSKITSVPPFASLVTGADATRVYFANTIQDYVESDGHQRKELALLDAWCNASDKGLKRKENYSDSQTREIAEVLDYI